MMMVTRPFRIKFWDRMFGSEQPLFESRKIHEFGNVNRAKVGESVAVSGCVKWLSRSRDRDRDRDHDHDRGRRTFVLFPTHFSNQVYLLCENLSERDPGENSYIEIDGRVAYSVASTSTSTSTGTLSEGEAYAHAYAGSPFPSPASVPGFPVRKVIQVLSWKEVTPDVPKTGYRYEYFKEDLTGRIEGLERPQYDFLAFIALSSPSFFSNIGGISSTLYDSTESGLSRLVAKEMDLVIPDDINKPFVEETPCGSVRLFYKFAYYSKKAERADQHLIARTAPSPKVRDEISLSLYSDRSKPVTVMDPPLNLSDVPTVISAEVSVDGSKRGHFNLDAFKYMLNKHMAAPAVEDYKGINYAIEGGLRRLKEAYGLDSSYLGYGFLNANYYARPASIVRMAMAYARINGIDRIDKCLVEKVFKEYFEWNFQYAFEICEDLSKPGMPLSLGAEERRVVRAIGKGEDSGVTVGDVASELKEKPHVVEARIRDMVRRGLIYEPMPGRYKLA